MNWSEKTVLLTGGNGFLGKSVLKQLENKEIKKLIIPSSEDADLRKKDICEKILHEVDLVIHLAGKGGGIEFMRENPADIFYDNLIMSTHLMHEAKQANVEKFLALGTVCSYPKFSSIPFNENEMWDGYPEETNAAYGLSKKMMIVQSDAYRQQYGFNSINIIPTNLYGPNDDFNPKTSHVIPGIIMKIQKAINEGSKEITLWGDGTPTRDFLYVDDAARGIILAMEGYNESVPVNLGSMTEISINDIAGKISKIMRFDGEIKWDASKPNGQPRRCVGNNNAEKKFGFKSEINIDEGLKNTIEWFYSQ
tara:strand:+ start:8917 stop:9840 length:924 start_codon:yes stop_codon:yes gene_type:complete